MSGACGETGVSPVQPGGDARLSTAQRVFDIQ